MYSLTRFSLKDMTECGATLRRLGTGMVSMEAAANQLVNYFYNHFLDLEADRSAFALVRCFKTHSYSLLPPDLQQLVNQGSERLSALSDFKCLTLLATTGDLPEWRSRRFSIGHQVIPLPSEQIVTQVPMISQLIEQLGLTIGNVICPSPDMLVDLQERTYNVFHIPEAKGSPYIPAQDTFVHPFKVKSVLGFGGILPSGNLIAIILFSKVSIQRETAELFKPLALNAKMAVLPFDRGPIFTSGAG